MAIDREQILECFKVRRTAGRRSLLDNVVYHLATMILQQRDFPDVKSLITFCADPENLSSWLPSRDDRTAFSAGLVQTLRSVCAA